MTLDSVSVPFPDTASGESSPDVLRVSNLKTSFATENGMVTAVDGVSFNLKRGEVLGIVGESGCGKSVTADSIMRLLDENTTFYEGSIEFDEEIELLSLSEARMRKMRGNHLSMIFQDTMSSLNPVYTVGDQIIEAVRAHANMSEEEARARAISLLERTGIPDPDQRMRQYPHQLSGGQRQRVVIAMALAGAPDVLIADEPTTALDVTTQAQILKLMNEVRKEFDTGTIFITHDLGVVAEVCDRVLVMYLGQVVEDTDVYSLFDSPLHPYTRGLLQATLTLDADPAVDIAAIPGAVPTLHNIPGGCRFADRCVFAIDACREEVPTLRVTDVDDTQEQHAVRCIRAEEIAAGAPKTRNDSVDELTRTQSEVDDGE